MNARDDAVRHWTEYLFLWFPWLKRAVRTYPHDQATTARDHVVGEENFRFHLGELIQGAFDAGREQGRQEAARDCGEQLARLRNLLRRSQDAKATEAVP